MIFANDSCVLKEHSSSEKKSVGECTIPNENICERVESEILDREIVQTAEEEKNNNFSLVSRVSESPEKVKKILSPKIDNIQKSQESGL